MPVSPAKSEYRGRFAPSPSGPLHLGSLVTALGSYLQTRANQGEWLVRIDDLDTPRVQPGASDAILHCLDAHGLQWDASPIYQSANIHQYEQALESLKAKGLLYPCDCTRQMVKARGPIYTGFCRNRHDVKPPFALRVKNQQQLAYLEDVLWGQVAIDPVTTSEDFIVLRRDGLLAYHLASVVDDIQMSLTEVVRGLDLLQPTACQLTLFKLFGVTPPDFLHLPLVTFSDGRKFSKQNHAPALDNSKAGVNLVEALHFLGFHPPQSLCASSVTDILTWALQNWSLAALKKHTQISDAFQGK